jgi:hypothetical protein
MKFMIKKEHIAMIVLLMIAVLSCMGPKKVAYDFPSTMNESVQKEYLRQCEKGAVLYEISCSGCHTKKSMLSKKVPDFTADQIYGYEIRRSNRNHENALTAETVTTEELGYILNFLMYKKRSGLLHKGTHVEN